MIFHQTRHQANLLAGIIGAVSLLTACATTSETVGEGLIDLPLVMLDKIEQQSSFAFDENLLTPETPAEIAAQEEAIRLRDLLDDQRLAEREAAKAAGLCEVENSPVPPVCEYISTPASLMAIDIPRFAAPFQVQFLMNERGAPTAPLLALNPALQEWEARHVCGGSMIASGWAITAAHCFAAPNADRTAYTVSDWAYSVRVDVENIATDQSKSLPIKKITLHPKYKISDSSNDLALVQFEADSLNSGTQTPWFDGTAVSKDNRIRQVELTPQGIEIKDVNGQRLLLEYSTRKLSANPYAPLVRDVVKDTFEAQYQSSGHLRLMDHYTDTRTNIGRSTLEYGRAELDPSGTHIVLIGYRQLGEIWSVLDKTRVATFDTGPVQFGGTILFSNDGKKFHFWTRAGESQIRETKTGLLLKTINHSLPVNDAKQGPNGFIVIEGLLGSVELLNVETEAVTLRIFHGGGLVHTDWNEQHLLTWSNDGRIRLFDLQTGEQILHYIHSGDVLDGPVQVTVPDDPARVQLISLSDVDPELETTLTAYGWGKTHFEITNVASAVLRQLALSPISWSDCNASRDRRNAEISARTNRRFSPSTTDPSAFCARGAGRKTCRGDSGGPIVSGTHLVGVVSRGSGVCWTDNAPSTFTSIAKANDWIRGVICQSLEQRNANQAFCSSTD